MKKILLFILLFFSFINVFADEINLNAKSVILIDQNSGDILYALNEHEKRPMASMTKIMSLLLIMEQIDKGNLKYDDVVEITEEASNMGGSQVFLQTGDKYKVSDLLKCVAMASANDAITALAIKTYGTVENFVSKMNDKAKELGLNDTNFVNVHGLDEDNHYSSAYDMAIISKNLIKYDDILKYTSVYEEYLQRPDGSQIWLVNTNKLVRFYEGVDGLKTGYTESAGYCLTATISKNNLRLISVVMGEESIEKRSQDVVKLINYGFSNYKVNLIKKKGEIIGNIKVKNAKKEINQLILMKDAKDLMNVQDKNKKYTYKLKLDDVKAPIKKGKVIGKVYVYNEDNNLIDKVNVTVNEDVLKASLWDLFCKNLNTSLSFKI